MPARPALKAATAPKAAVRLRPDLSREAALAPMVVCGVDEAGRGPWAGPVCAAAVVLAPEAALAGVDDSKKLTPKTRAALEGEIKRAALAWAVAYATVEEIAALNILHATGLAMRRAVALLPSPAAAALVDGNYAFSLPCRTHTLVGGDGLSLSVAAASVLAKTARDRLMTAMGLRHPGYGFERHKGYHAAEHVEALRRLGPSPIHRRSWAPIRAALEGAEAPAALAAE